MSIAPVPDALLSSHDALCQNLAKMEQRVRGPFLMRTRSQFVMWLQSRRSAGESLASIARGFGVSAVTVKLWLDGKRNPSRMALVLAGLLAQRDAGNWPL
jgi:hypothetical protein